MTSKSRLLSSTVNKPSSLIGASLSNPNEVNLQALETAAVKYTASSQLPSTGNIGEQAFVEETNRLYIWNGSGWYNIALINTTPTWDSNGQPNATYELSADDPQTATTITLAASDPEGIPVSYTSVTGGSMDSIATVSQDSSVFTITPKTSTQAPDGGTGSITFRATDSVNILTQVSSFTLNFVSTVGDSKHTSLLVNVNDTGNTTLSGVLTDSSNNNYTFEGFSQWGGRTSTNSTTPIGLAASTLTPYRGGGYSSYGHFRPEATVSSTLDTWSLSFWYKLNSVIDYARVFETQSGSFSMMIETDNGGQFLVGSAFETQNDGSGNNYLDSNWHYFVVSRTPSATNWYMDGAQITTARNGSTITTTLSSLTAQAVRNMTFGGRDASSDLGSLPTTNLADINFRDIELKSTTHDGSVPTEPVTSSSDTVFLTAHKPYGAYEYGATPTSANIGTLGTNFKILSLSPYDYEEYDAAINGISLSNWYHSSMSSWQAIKLNDASSIADFKLDYNNFTIKFWMYHQDLSVVGNHGICGNARYSDNSGFNLRMQNTGITGNVNKLTLWERSGSTNITHVLTDEIKEKQWYYVEITNTSGTITCKVNGVQQSGTHSKSQNSATPTHSWNLGASAHGTNEYGWGSNIKGEICDFQWVNGATSPESSVPTEPMSTDANALVHFKSNNSNINIIDKSQNSNLLLHGNTTGSTTQVKFAGSKSMYFDGTGDYIPVITDFFYKKNTSNASITEFTIETWVYHTARLTSSGYNHIFQTIVGLGNVGMAFGIGPSGNLKFYHQSSSTNVVTSTSTIPLNTWTHIAVIVDGSQGSNGVTLKINGSTDGTGSWNGISTSQSDQSLPFSNPHFTIGRYPDAFASHQQFEGYLQDLRISNIARTITSAPTAPLEG